MGKPKPRIFLFIFFGISVCGLAACAKIQSVIKPGQPTLFVPSSASGATPLANFAATPTLQDTPAPTPTPACLDDLDFVADVTIPDSTVVQPGEKLDKRWLVQNSGACSWGEDYRIRLVSGPEMGSAVEQALYPARSGVQAMVRMLFTAPQESGLYRSAWQAYNERGEPFGDPFFIEIVVSAK